MTTTPTTPSTTPITRCVVSLFSWNDAITSAVNSGVMAFMMPASPTLTMVCPAFRRLNGSTSLSNPMTRKGIQADRLRGSPRR